MSIKIDMGGAWQFQERGKEPWDEGTVPGCVQLDLMNLGRLSDPFYRQNELDAHRLEGKEWIYQKHIIFEKPVNTDRVYLTFEGIDTVSDIYLNETWIGHTENMFMTYRFDVTDILQNGENILKVHIHSSIAWAREKNAQNGADYISTGDKSRVFIRKAQYAYGWDWGPRIEQVGIFRPVYLEIVQKARLFYPSFDTLCLDNNLAHVQIGADIALFSEDVSVCACICFEGKKIKEVAATLTQTENGLCCIMKTSIENPQIWYPNGLGTQPLYEIHISASHGKQVYDTLVFYGGIRTAKLLREKDTQGESFVFEINGQKVFAKGANWIPGDSLLPRMTPEKYEKDILLAKNANMNMLRVWGGGIYETPEFYDACDKHGIMVWQDFPYACGQYPDHNEEFRSLAMKEAAQAVRLLRVHPSLVLWCGNNENNQGFYVWKSSENDPEYFGNYMYKKALPSICRQLDPHREYWIGSPYGGADPNAPNEGDRHSWDVWAYDKPYLSYRKDTGRFISEFGFLAMPCYKTIEEFTVAEDRHINSPVMLSHIKAVDGAKKLFAYLAFDIGFPRDFKSYVYLSQYEQAEAIKVAVEHWRTRAYATAGTLYWQLNDCYPVASWSAVDYGRRKKALYYYSRHFYNPLLPILSPVGDGIDLSIINENEAVSATLRITSYALCGRKRSEIIFPYEVKANTTEMVRTFTLQALGFSYKPVIHSGTENWVNTSKEENGDLLDGCIFVEMTYEGGIIRNFLCFDVPAKMPLCIPNIKIHQSDNRITLTTDIPAFGVFLETQNDIDVSDNCLTMEPGIPYTVLCSANPGQIKVMDITNMTQKI